MATLSIEDLIPFLENTPLQAVPLIIREHASRYKHLDYPVAKLYKLALQNLQRGCNTIKQLTPAGIISDAHRLNQGQNPLYLRDFSNERVYHNTTERLKTPARSLF